MSKIQMKVNDLKSINGGMTVVADGEPEKKGCPNGYSACNKENCAGCANLTRLNRTKKICMLGVPGSVITL